MQKLAESHSRSKRNAPCSPKSKRAGPQVRYGQLWQPAPYHHISCRAPDRSFGRERPPLRADTLFRCTRRTRSRSPCRPASPSSCLAQLRTGRYRPAAGEWHGPLDHSCGPRGLANLGVIFVGKRQKTLLGERIGLPGKVADAQRLLPEKFNVHEIPHATKTGI